MEFLIIIFIIISLLSSLSRQAKKGGNNAGERRKKRVLFDPWSFEEGFPFPEDRLKREDENTVSILLEKERDSAFPIEIDSRVRELEKEHLVEDTTPLEDLLEEDRKIIIPTYEEAKELIDPSYFVDEKKEETTTAKTESLYLEKELAQLLKSGQLPIAIVFAEILGPPRSLNPVRKRLYSTYQENR